MAKISTYPVDGLISTDDFIIGSDAENVNITKNFTVGGILSLATLESVLDNGNTATNNISLTGNITATNVSVSGQVTTGDIEVSGLLYDASASEGVNGQFLKSTGTGTSWSAVPADTLQAVLTAGNTTSLNIVSTGDITADAINANAVEADDFTVNSQLSITGTIEANSSIGTSGQYLTSQAGTGSVQWTSLPIAGWNRFDDGQYTSASPLTVVNGTTETLPNNGEKLAADYGVENFYNKTTNTVLAINENDTYMITVTFKAAASNASNGHLDIAMSGPAGYDRIAETLKFAKGNGETQNFHMVYQYYADADFVANGAHFEVAAVGSDVSIWDIIYFIQRVQIA